MEGPVQIRLEGHDVPNQTTKGRYCCDRWPSLRWPPLAVVAILVATVVLPVFGRLSYCQHSMRPNLNGLNGLNSEPFVAALHPCY